MIKTIVVNINDNVAIALHNFQKNEVIEISSGQDAFLMATFHHYDPWEFNGEGNKTFAWNAQTISTPPCKPWKYGAIA